MTSRRAIQRPVLAASLCVVALSCLTLWPQVPKPRPTPEASTGSKTPTPSAPQLTASDVEAFLAGVVPMQLQREDIAGAGAVAVKAGNSLVSTRYSNAERNARTLMRSTRTPLRPGP